MYALAVIDWLVAQHNELVQIVAGGCFSQSGNAMGVEWEVKIGDIEWTQLVLKLGIFMGALGFIWI